MTEDFCEVVITAEDAEWLAGFTRSLVEDRLAASGHTISTIRSIYRWQGRIEDRSEAKVALHTPDDAAACHHRAHESSAPVPGAGHRGFGDHWRKHRLPGVDRAGDSRA